MNSARRGDALLNLIGNTPLIPLRFAAENRTIWAKCEFLNPSGSIKDRLAKTVILDAEKRGQLHPESIILECTSGNTVLRSPWSAPLAVIAWPSSCQPGQHRTTQDHRAFRRGVDFV